MIIAMALLSIMDAGLKLFSVHYPPLQVCALRGLASWPLVALWVGWTVGPRALLRAWASSARWANTR